MFNDSFIEKINISVESMMASACRRTGLSDWGDESFIMPLNILVESFLKDNKDYTKNIFFRNECIRLLSNRLLIEEDLKLHPEILDIEIEKPLFIIGLGRTGSTFLHNLFTQDPNCRTLKYWELLRPSLPKSMQSQNTDPRIRLAEKEVEAMQRRFPELWNKHELKATNPEECCQLMMHTFMSRHFYVSWDVPTYIQWLCNQNLTPTYDYYKKLLKLLLFRTGGFPLILKDPMHLPCIDILLKMFPDANFVWTHRNPENIISSYYSLSNTIKGHVPHDEMKLGIKHLFNDIEAALNVRNNADPKKFYDVSYVELVKEPISVVKKVYEYFGYTFETKMEDNIKNWLLENPKNKHGLHNHSLENLSLSQDFVRKEFSAYYEHFGDFIC